MTENKDVLPETIVKFKQLFTKEEEKIFRAVWLSTMYAIEALEREPYSDQAFRPTTEDSYPRGKACQIDFTTLGVAILQVTKDVPDEARLKNALKTLPADLDELKENLLVFLSEDRESTRKAVYQQALDYLDKVMRIFNPSKPSASYKQ